MKRLLAFLFAFTLMLSGCSAAAPATQTSAATDPIELDTSTKKESVPMEKETGVEEVVFPENAPQSENNLQSETVPTQEEQPAETPTANTTTQQKTTQLANTAPTKQETTDKQQPTTQQETTKPSTTASGNTTTATYPAATNNNVLLFVGSQQIYYLDAQTALCFLYCGNQKLTWHSSDPEGLIVDQSGKITPVRAGNYTVYVTDGEYTAKKEISVPKDLNTPGGIYFAQTKTELTVGQSTLLNLSGAAPDYVISYYSSDASVVQVSGIYMTAVAPGTAIISARANHYPQQATKMVVTVVPAAQTVSLDIQQDSIDLYRLEEQVLSCQYSGSAALTWESSNSCVATVDENGHVFAHDTGSCYIYLSDGTYADQCKVTVSVDPTVTITKLDFNNINAPIYDGITKYKGDYMEFRVSIFPQNGDEDTYITVSNSQIIKATRTYSMGDYIFRLDFKKAGTCTVNIHSGDHAVTNSYTFHVKEDYDCNPGKNLLTPEEFVNCYNQVLQANGMSLDYKPTGYLVLTLSPEELTWAQARKSAEGLGHHWWSIGYRHMLITYEGQDQNGNYIFYERGC